MFHIPWGIGIPYWTNLNRLFYSGCKRLSPKKCHGIRRHVCFVRCISRNVPPHWWCVDMTARNKRSTPPKMRNDDLWLIHLLACLFTFLLTHFLTSLLPFMTNLLACLLTCILIYLLNYKNIKSTIMGIFSGFKSDLNGRKQSNMWVSLNMWI